MRQIWNLQCAKSGVTVRQIWRTYTLRYTSLLHLQGQPVMGDQ